MYYSIHFSPTGGTKKAADILVNKLSSQYTEIDLCREVGPMTFHSGDICLISVPSYGGRVPAIAVERLRNISGNGAKAILNCVYGNRHWDDTLTELQDTLEHIGFICVAAIAAVAEHSLFRQFGTGRPDAEDIAQLEDFAAQIQKKLDNNEFRKLELEGSHHTYKVYNGVPFKPMTNESCKGCGLCAKECPAAAIPPETPQMTDTEKCISCMRCISLCPTHARNLDASLLSAMGEKLAPALGGRKNNYLFL